MNINGDFKTILLCAQIPCFLCHGKGAPNIKDAWVLCPACLDMCPRLTSLNPRTTLRWCLAIVPFLINWRHRKVRMLGGSHSKWVIDSSLRQFLYSPISSNFPNFMYVQYIHLFVFIEYNSVTCVSLTSFCSFCNYTLKIPNGFTQHHKDPSCHLP